MNTGLFSRLLRGAAIAVIGAVFPAHTSAANAQNASFPIYSDSTITASERYIQGNKYQKDLLLFTGMLEECHPAFAPERPQPLDIARIRDEGYAWAGSCLSDTEFKTYLQDIMTRLGDGHSSLLPDLDYNRIYPFAIMKVEDKIILSAVCREYGELLGREITEINGAGTAEVMNSFRSVMSSDNDNYFTSKVGGYMQFASNWNGNPFRAGDDSLTLTFADGRTIKLGACPQNSLNIQWLPSVSTSPELFIRSKQPFTYRLYPEKGLCYMEFNTCADQSTLRSQIYTQGLQGQISEEELERKLAAVPRFDESVERMFADIHSHGISTLVIDVRDNSGGNSRLGDILLSWLRPVGGTLQYTASIKLSSLWKANYPQLAKEYEEAFAAAGEQMTMGKLYDAEWLSSITSNDTSAYEIMEPYFRMNSDTSSIFKGRVFILQGDRTYSSAGMFVTAAQDNRIGTVVGRSSTYRPSHFGDLLRWRLPNTGTCGFLSHKIFHRPDLSKDTEAALEPDIPVNPDMEDIMSGADPYEECILKLL